MKSTIKVTELTHEELVTIFSDALYGNNAMGVKIPKEYAHLKDMGEGDCWEDKIANVLLNGGCIDIADYYDESESEDDAEWYGKQNINWVSKEYKYVEQTSWYYGTREVGIPTYRINLETLLNGISNERGCKYLHTMFVDEEGDMWTAYNLLQIAVFGEEIYG